MTIWLIVSSAGWFEHLICRYTDWRLPSNWSSLFRNHCSHLYNVLINPFIYAAKHDDVKNQLLTWFRCKRLDDTKATTSKITEVSDTTYKWKEDNSSGKSTLGNFHDMRTVCWFMRRLHDPAGRPDYRSDYRSDNLTNVYTVKLSILER